MNAIADIADRIFSGSDAAWAEISAGACTLLAERNGISFTDAVAKYTLDGKPTVIATLYILNMLPMPDPRPPLENSDKLNER